MTQIDLLSSAALSDPYPMYRYLQENEPLFRSQLFGGAWVLTRYSDVLEGMKTLPLREVYSDSSRMLSLGTDIPEHTRFRNLVQTMFSPSAIQQRSDAIESLVKKLIQGLGSSFDVVRDLAIPVSTSIIGQIVGFDMKNLFALRDRSDSLARFIGSGMPSRETFEKAASDHGIFEDEVRRIIELRKKKPEQDLISLLLSSWENGNSITEEELIGICIFMLPAGQETTTNLITNSVLSLLRFPDQLRLLRQNPKLLPDALDELMRLESPIQWIARAATRDFELYGVPIKKKDRVLLYLGAANRDPSVFPEPERLKIDRRNVKKHLAFGFGSFYCIGAHLARQEAMICLQSLITHFPDLRLMEQELEWAEGTAFRSLRSLKVQVGGHE